MPYLSDASYKAKENNFRLSLFTASGTPSMAKDVTAQTIWRATLCVINQQCSSLDQWALQDLQEVINQRKAALYYFKSQGTSDTGYTFWIAFLERVHRMLCAQSEPQDLATYQNSQSTSVSMGESRVDSETAQLRARVQDLDIEEGRRTRWVSPSAELASSTDLQPTLIDPINTEPTVTESVIAKSMPAEPMSLEESGNDIAILLHLQTLQEIGDKVGQIWQKAARGNSDLITTVQVSNILREYAQEDLNELVGFQQNALHTASLRYPIAADIIKAPRNQKRFNQKYRRTIREHGERLNWPPLVRTIAQDDKALGNTSCLDFWLISKAISGWNDHDEGESRTPKFEELRGAVSAHLQQLDDLIHHNKEGFCQSDTRVLIENVRNFLQSEGSGSIDPWSMCYLCADITVRRAMAEVILAEKYGAMLLLRHYFGTLADLTSITSAINKTITALERHLYPQGPPQTMEAFRFQYQKFTNVKYFDRLYQSAQRRLPLGVLLSNDKYRTSGLIQRLSESKNSLAEEHDMRILLDGIERLLALENDTPYFLDGHGWNAVENYLKSGFKDTEALRRVESGIGLRFRSMRLNMSTSS